MGKLLKAVRQTLETENLERLEQIQAEVLKYDGLENAVGMIIEMANKG
jgi:hypothetical protein